MTKQKVRSRKKTRKVVVLSISLLICIWLFRPLSERELIRTARYGLEDVLFEMNRINPALFRGDPVIKHKRGSKWFEWEYQSGSDVLAIGIRVSRCNIGNLFPLKCYIMDKADISNQLAWTDPRYAKSRPQYW